MKHLKLFFALFAMLALGVGNAWGADPSVGDVIFQEEFTVTAKTMANAYNFAGTTTWSGSTSGLSYASSSTSSYMETQTANPITSANFFFVKASESNLTMSGISIPSNTTAITVSFQSNKTIVKCTYSFDGTNFSTGATSKSGVQTFDIDCTGKSKLYFKFSKTGTGSNARIDNVIVKVKTISSPSATPVDPTATFSNGSYTVGQTLDLSTLWTSNSTGEVTYTVASAGTTGATISGSLFTATAAGTCTVKASQAATSAYNAIEKSATVTVTAPTPATITLSEAGQVKTVEGKYVGDSYELPLTSTQTCGDKVFVGWSTVEIATPGDKPTSNFYEPGTTVTLVAEQTFYAVYATGSGTPETWEKTTSVAVGDLVVIAQVDDGTKEMTGLGKTPVTDNNNYGTGTDFLTNPNGTLVWTVEEGNAPGQFSFNNGSYYLNLGSDNNYLNYSATKNANSSWTVSTEDERAVVANAAYNSRKIMWNKNNTRFASYSKNHGNNSGQYYYHIVFYKKSGGISYSDYTTSCSGSTEPVVSLTDEQLNWSATSATALKGADNNAFPTLTNSITVPVTYSSSNTSVATIAADGKITLLASGTTTISAIFAGGKVGGTTYAAKTVSYTMTVKQLVSCAEIYNLADEATFVLKDFVVTYVNGTYTYIKDNEGGYGLIFTNSGEYGLKAGEQVASGKFEGKKDTYYGLVEIIPTTEVGDLGATSGTAPEPEVMTNTPTNADINKYVKFENVSFKYTNLNDTHKTNSGKLEGQTEYNIAFYNKFTSNVTFDTSKKYDVVGVVSIKDDAIKVYFISAEEVAEPTLNLTTTPIDFGKVAINSTNESTLQLSGSLLTKDITLSVEGDSYFTVSANSITPSEGSVNETITITYEPTVEGTHTATLKITSDELTEQTITLTGNAVEEYTVHFYVNGEEQTDLAKKVLSGNTLEELPTATSCDPLEYPTFIGWSASEITGTTDVEPTDLLDLNTTITADCNYYAVFAKETTTSSSSESATMAYGGTSTTNMEDGNNASTVGLDEALFTITSDKGGQNNHVGLNTEGDIRLYANKADGNGNILTIAMAEGYTITQISLDIKQNATFVVKANGQSISGTDNVYDINHSSCSIQNTTTGATTQLRLNSITISYTTSTISKEYLTTCESATPTYTVTYNLDGGESTCETSVVVEQDGELTLCDAPTKTGHTFLKWKDQSDNEYEAGATITVSSNLTLTAQWQKESYKVTWMSLGEEVGSANVEYNSQPTKPATDPTYTCYGEKEFVGWTTKEIDGVGTPTNLYTDEFPVVTEPITYYAVFATRISEGSNLSKAITLANGDIVYLATENGHGISGANDNEKDATVSTNQNEWLSFTVETTDNTLFQFKNGEKYITAGAKQFKLTTTASNFTFSNGYIVYEISSGSDQGDYVLLENTNNGTFYRFYKISNMGAANYTTFYVYKDASFTDYITSCDAVTSSISIDNISLCVGDVHTITATIKPATAASAVSYTIKENATNAISLSGNTITALAEGTATITATIEDATDYAGSSIDFKVTVDAAPVTSKVVILAQHGGQWYAMKAEYYEENKSLNAIPVTYINGTLYNVADAEKAAIEWERTTRGNTATFKKGENYLIGTTGTDLKLGDIAFEWAVDGNLYLCDDNKRTFIFNKGGYFKNYDKTNNSNGVAIDATYSSLPVVTAPVYATGDAYGRTVTTGNFGTICIPYGSSNYKGAEFYEVAWVKMNEESMPTTLYLDQLEAGATLEAGKPYIFKATATEIAIIGDGTSVTDPITGKNGLRGTFEDITAGGLLVDNYIIAQNQFWTATAENYLNAYRAYIVPSSIPTTEPAEIPGRRRIAMGAAGENEATGLDNITTTDTPVKVIVNGQLIIIREGVKYNVQGQKL